MEYRVIIDQAGRVIEFGVGSYGHAMTFRPGLLAEPHNFKILRSDRWRKREVIWHERDGRLVNG